MIKLTDKQAEVAAVAGELVCDSVHERRETWPIRKRGYWTATLFSSKRKADAIAKANTIADPDWIYRVEPTSIGLYKIAVIAPEEILVESDGQAVYSNHNDGFLGYL